MVYTETMKANQDPSAQAKLNASPGIVWDSGCHSEASFASTHLNPHFDSGVITPHPKADFYAVCYGELCAYSNAINEHGHHVLLATWSAGVPDCEEDAEPKPDYNGEWLAQVY